MDGTSHLKTTVLVLLRKTNQLTNQEFSFSAQTSGSCLHSTSSDRAAENNPQPVKGVTPSAHKDDSFSGPGRALFLLAVLPSLSMRTSIFKQKLKQILIESFNPRRAKAMDAHQRLGTLLTDTSTNFNILLTLVTRHLNTFILRSSQGRLGFVRPQAQIWKSKINLNIDTQIFR